jgi:hypothetical protein
MKIQRDTETAPVSTRFIKIEEGLAPLLLKKLNGNQSDRAIPEKISNDAIESTILMLVKLTKA